VTTMTQVPLVTTVHGTDIRMLETVSSLKPIVRSVFKRSAAVTTVSHWLARQAKTLQSGTTFQVAPMPAAAEWFTPEGPRTSDRVLFVGRLNAQKGIEYAIRAVAKMHTTARLDVIGAGTLLAESQELARTLGIADRVCFLGEVAQHELAPFYRQAAVLVVPSIGEGLGLVAVEAQLCETPVVAFSSGGITDVIQHGHTGLLVPERDIMALATALEQVLNNPALAAALGQAGRAAALSTFAPSSVARKYAGIYREALQRRAA
jgi:glycosyltransferase involved in cell wall biosynthesis